MLDQTPDPDDGEPVWSLPDGHLLVPDHFAVRRLGVGLRCETWLTWWVAPWCPAVVKLARPHCVDHPRARATLTRETDALGDSIHPSLPVLLVDGRDHDIPYTATEYVDGPDLATAIDDDGPLTPVEVSLLGVQLLAALAVVHRRGFAHVDVKPDNVVLRDGRPVLIDFGSARRLGSAQPPGRPIGTAGYAAPELEAAEPISTAMDVFGVGATLYEALSGERAFDPGLPAELRPHAERLVGHDPVLSELVLAMLDPEPAARPSAEQVMVALARGVEDDRLRPWPHWADAHLSRLTRT